MERSEPSRADRRDDYDDDRKDDGEGGGACAGEDHECVGKKAVWGGRVKSEVGRGRRAGGVAHLVLSR